jgi:hypothetical protein
MSSRSLILVCCWLVLAACTANRKTTPSSHRDAGPWQDLFAGQSVDQLKGYRQAGFPTGAWVVDQGALKTVTGVPNVDLLTRERYKNFELTFEWKVSAGGNSGVFFHVQEEHQQEAGNGNSPNWLRNYEMQLLDDIGFDDKEPKRSAGALYDLIAPQNKVLKPVGEYNTARLLVHDQHVEHWLNGQKVVEYQPDSPEMKALIGNSKFKDIQGFAQYTEGYVMFQHHGQEVWYRNIKIRRL